MPIKKNEARLSARATSCVIGLALITAAGCTHYMPAAVSSTSIGNQGEIPVKVVSGSSSSSSFLFFGPFGDASLNAALEDARRFGDGDTLANVFVDRILFCFPACFIPIYSSIETRITGTLVKYKDERSLQYQNAPAIQEPTAAGSKKNVPPAAAYDQMLAAHGQDLLMAEAIYKAYNRRTQSDLKHFVTTTRGDDSSWNWKLKIPVNATENEKRFLIWFVKTYTSYKPVD